MFKRQQRLRREFLYRKDIENKVKTIHENKSAIKKSYEEGEQIPTHLQKDAIAIKKSLAFDDQGGEGVTTSQDDEYRWAAVEDPKIFLTTSHNPSAKLKMFVKELKLVIPNCIRKNRGHLTLSDIVQACKANNFTDIIVITETRGIPDGMVVSHLPFGPTAYFTLRHVVMRHEIPNIEGHMPQAYPHLIFHNFTSPLGLRTRNILKYLFPVPKEDSKRIVCFYNSDDTIYFEHTLRKKNNRKWEIETLGPSFQMILYKIILGTMDLSTTADEEWSYRPYMNTTKKRKFLSTE